MDIHLDTDIGGDMDDLADYPRDYPALPSDFINFQHDPLAVAIALG